MLASPPTTISDAIVVLFENHREMTALELHRALSKKYFQCTLRAVYKELNNLISTGVVIKVRDYYSLSITWILNLIRTSERLYDVSVGQRPRATRLPVEGERIRWQFRDLQHLDRFWIQLIFLLFENSKTRTMFAWVPHFWFDLVHLEKDLEAQEAMKIAGNKMYMILGGRTFLDRLPTRYWSKKVYAWSYAVSPFEKDRNTYFDVIDDWVLTVTLDSETTRKIHELFLSVKTKADLGKTTAFQAIKSGAKAKVVLERNAKKAGVFRRKCCAYFGVHDPQKN